MFEKIRVRWAVSIALADLGRTGVITNETRAIMQSVSHHLINALYGAELLASGAAINKHAAAAAVFARLAEAAQSTPVAPVSSDDWIAAGQAAMVNAGMPRFEAMAAVFKLIEINRKSKIGALSEGKRNRDHQPWASKDR